MADFEYKPDRNLTTNSTPNVKVVQFGDGYSKRSPAYLNNINNTWNLTFKNRVDTEIDPIVTFFEARKGSQAFTWRPPGADADITVICTKWAETYIAENQTNVFKTLTAEFRRVYE